MPRSRSRSRDREYHHVVIVACTNPSIEQQIKSHFMRQNYFIYDHMYPFRLSAELILRCKVKENPECKNEVENTAQALEKVFDAQFAAKQFLSFYAQNNTKFAHQHVLVMGVVEPSAFDQIVEHGALPISLDPKFEGCVTLRESHFKIRDLDDIIEEYQPQYNFKL